MKTQELNVNEYIFVKLTEHGKKLHRKAYDDLMKLCGGKLAFPYEGPGIDSDGWTKCQLWRLMAMFGSELYNACELPFETIIRIPTHEHPLAHMFELQAGLNARCGVVLDNLTDEQKTEWTIKYTLAMQQEMAELIDSVPWKWWSKHQEFDGQNAKVEIVDMLHFLISLAQVHGMTADDVYQAYLKKNQVNHNRQDSGYTVKDENDSRHI